MVAVSLVLLVSLAVGSPTRWHRVAATADSLPVPKMRSIRPDASSSVRLAGKIAGRSPIPSDLARVAADTARVVRRFPPIEVTAPLLDLPSSQTRHVIDSEALRTLPIDGFAEVLALQPGVVAQ